MPETPAAAIPRLLAAMESWKASDLFLCEGKVPTARVNGEVRAVKLPATTTEEMAAFLDEALSPVNRARFDERGDLDLGWSLDDAHRFRLNLYRQKGQVSLVARALPSGAVELESLGLPPSVGRLADLPRGLVLVTGATGSGKSTTLAALVHRINTTRRVHVVTVEDPIEFVHADLLARISQREIGNDTPSFVTALRHVVRQSPDVILIGEMRDVETMSVALSAALTGHLVLATLHTIDATQTLQRILSYFPEHLRAQACMDLSLCLKGIVSQRLLPDASGQGRALACEVLTSNPAVVRLLREQRVDELEDLMRGANDPDMVTFNSSLLDLYKAQKITYEMGRAYASNPEEFALGARGMRTGGGGFRGSVNIESAVGLDMKALLGLTLEKGASDLHLAVGRPPIMRINGQLEPLVIRALTASDVRTLLYSILNTRQREIYDLEREIDFALSLDNGQRFRVNAYYQKGNMAVALRVIATEIPTPKALGLPAVLVDLGQRSHGLLLVVGPTGSGKSTTLACLIDQINRMRACRIITVEDPIEYVHVGKKATVDQRELFHDTKSFASALKYVLRQDPDVILVGEMRDLETMSAALTAAETGHLVLATLHTNDAIGAIDRIVDAFPAHQQTQIRSQVAACLLGVVSQRLLQRSDGLSRVAAFEILVATPALRNVIRENKMHQALSLMETAGREGMVTMDNALKDLYEQGLINRAEALRYVKHASKIKE